MIDFHIHSNTSGDNDNVIKDIYKTAVEKGMKYICLTNHHEMDDTSEYHLTITDEEIEQCRKEISDLNSTDDKTEFLLGIEMGYDEDHEEEIRDFIRKHDFDFVIGSIHFIDGLQINDSLNKGKLPDDMLDKYFETLKKAIKFGEYDVIAHLDVFMRTLGQPDWNKIKHRWEEIGELLVEYDVGFELNSSKKEKYGSLFWPDDKIIKILVEKGVRKITFGSDSHNLHTIGKNFDKAVSLLKSLGIEEIYIFKKRRPIPIKI